MYKVIEVIIYKLWIAASLAIFSSFLVYWTFGGLLALGVLTLGLSGIFYNAQDLLLYYPNDPPDSREFVLQPSTFELPYESIKIKNKDGFLLHIFLIKQVNNSSQVPTMLFLHGNAGNMGQRLANVSGFFSKLNINIMMLEYRGYGLSEGTPTEKGLYTDAQSAMDYLLNRQDIDEKKIILFGRSLGGAVAIDLASKKEYRHKIYALIVENTFTSIPDMAHVILRWRCLHWMPAFIHKNRYMSIEKIGDVSAPTCVLCGSNDALVPPSMAKALFLQCGSALKKLIIISGGGHNDTWTCRDYYAAIVQFLVDVPPLACTNDYYDDVLKKPSTSKENTVHIV